MLKLSTHNFINDLFESVKSLLQTLLICSLLYTCIIWVIGQVMVPNKAEGSLILNAKGGVVGSRLIAQNFTDPGYFWSRPSAVNYNAAGSGGSNLSTNNPAIKQRIKESILQLQSGQNKPVPVDLVMASGSGLDPHITVQAALFQAERVAQARQADPRAVIELINKSTSRAIPLMGKPAVVNVLELNLLLDKELPYKNNKPSIR